MCKLQYCSNYTYQMHLVLNFCTFYTSLFHKQITDSIALTSFCGKSRSLDRSCYKPDVQCLYLFFLFLYTTSLYLFTNYLNLNILLALLNSNKHLPMLFTHCIILLKCPPQIHNHDIHK